MSDMNMRNKLIKVTEAAKNGEHITERSKSIGFTVFLAFIVLGIIALVGLSTALLFYGHWISAVIFFLTSAVFSYALFKLIAADDIRNL
jgi:CHASE2 domain-containing sensor protein